MCDNLQETMNDLTARGVAHAEFREAEWGVASCIRLPGGSNLGLYQPRHPLAVKRG